MAPAPRRVAHYEVVAPLARGGFGEVFEARDLRTGEAVALKVVATAAPEAAARFAREAHIAASLRHPGVVAVLAHGRVDHGASWLAMERLRGSDLRARLARGRLSPRDAAAVALGACEGLAHAHALGVVHRDVKPGNLFLCDDDPGRVKVLDFGLARRLDEDSLTATGALVGTLAYASPEQVRDARDVGPATDLWSLGVTLYECLTGRLPFHATHEAGLLYQIAFASPEGLGAAAPRAPRGLVALVDRMMSRERAARPTAAAATEALRGLLADSALDGAAEEDAPGAAPDESRSRERRLVCVAYARTLDGGAAPRELAEEFRAWGAETVVHFDGAVEARFGVDRWQGDEPARAVWVAWNLRRDGLSTSVATDVDDAARAARAAATSPGVYLDENTAALVRDAFAVGPASGGVARVEGVAALGPSGRPWVGRAAEIALLVDAAQQSAESRRLAGAVVLAPRGVGKSRLAAEAARALAVADPACAVFAAACQRSRRDVPFAALCGALGAAAAPLAALLAEGAGGAGDAVAFSDRVRALALAALRDACGAHGAVLSFDDAQWVDGATRALLRRVAEGADELPLAVWCFALPEARDVLVEALPDATVRALGPLTRAQAEGLLRALHGRADPDVIERAEGHPLFLEELARLDRAAGAPLPVTVQATVLATLDALDARGRDYLKRAAVAGRGFWAPLVERLGGDPGALPGLVRAQLVARRPASRFDDAPEYAFRSALVQETAYGLWGDDARAGLHGDAAAWLAPRPGVDPAELAPHWELAGARDEAALAWALAAERAAGVDDDITRAHVARALDLATDAGVRWRALAAADTSLQIAGDRAVQELGLERMELLAPALGLAEQAEVCWRRCYHARMTGRGDALRAWAERGVALAREAGAPRVEALLHDELALHLTDAGRYAEAGAHAAAAEALARAADDAWLRARTTATRAYHALEAGDVAAARRGFDEAAEGFLALGDARREALTRANGGYALVRLGALDEARERFERAVERSLRVGNARTVAMGRYNLAVLARARGALDEARALLDAAAADAARLGHTRLVAAVAAERCYLRLTAEGPAPDDGALADEALRAAERAGSPPLVTHARAVALRLRARGGAAEGEGASDGGRAAGDPEADAALAVARYEAGGRRADDRARLDEALAAFTRSLGPVDDPTLALRGFALRYALNG